MENVHALNIRGPRQQENKAATEEATNQEARPGKPADKRFAVDSDSRDILVG